MPGLREHNAVQDCIESSISAAVEPVADGSGRGRLEWSSSRVRSEISIGREAQAWAKNPSKRSGRKQIDAAQPGEWCKSGCHGEIGDAAGEFGDLVQRQS